MVSNKACLPAAVKLLAVRDHSEKELRQKLLRRYDAAEADAAIAILRERGYLDDDALARRLAGRCIDDGQHGRLGIRHRLQGRGLPAASIDAALADYDASAEHERAASLVSRRFPAASAAEAPKIGRFLAARGFASETVMAVLRRVCGYD